MIDLETLFRWKGELHVKGKNDEPILVDGKPLVLYQRVVGDADIAVARTNALKASRKLRAELRDKKSDSYFALVPDYTSMDESVIQNAVLLAESMDFRRGAREGIQNPKVPKEPKSDASIEDQEKYMTALEDYNKEIEKRTSTLFNDIIDKRRKELTKLSRDQLEDLFVTSITDSLCRAEMLRIFNFWCAYLGTFSDEKMAKRAFRNYANFDNSSTELKNMIASNYMALEIGGEDLKN